VVVIVGGVGRTRLQDPLSGIEQLDGRLTRKVAMHEGVDRELGEECLSVLLDVGGLKTWRSGGKVSGCSEARGLDHANWKGNAPCRASRR
jgi:hypothetical protein